MTRPLLLLDVDGPLNPFDAPPHRRPAGYQTHRLSPSGWTGRRPLRVWLNPSHGPALLALPADLVWCTTWEHDANRMIGPRIGLPELPVIEWPPDRGPGQHGTPSVHWKTRTVIEYAAGRPFVWVDDEVTAADREYVAARHRGVARLHDVNPRIGLAAEDFDFIGRWAAMCGEAV